MKAAIRMEGVSKRFGGDVALEGVDLEVPRGVVFALLGENGAGKSTALRILLGLAEADAGTAEVLDLDSARRGVEIRRRVGYVAERPTLYDWMTVDEIGWFAAGFYANGYLGHYRELTAGFHLPGQQRIRALSKGMRAKVSLALALAPNPDLLVLDEPTSGLDTFVRREFLESMVDRAAEGKTVLLASHQIHEVERVADIVAILHQGRLILAEPLDRLKAEIREITVTLDGDDMPPTPDGLLSLERRGRQCRMMVRETDDPWLAALKTHPAVVDVESHTPSLEQIFVAYVAGRTSA